MSLFLEPHELEALLLSLQVSLWAVVISLPIAILAGWFLAKYQFTGKMLLDGILYLPMVLPPVVVGFVLLILFGSQGPFGPMFDALGIPLAFTWRGAALAAAVVSFPLMVTSIRLAIEAVDGELEEAARTLGKNPWKVFFTITLPLSWPGIVTGTILAFSRGLGEFGATITFVSNIPGETRTLPLALLAQTELPGGEESAMRLAVISILLALGGLIGSKWLQKKFQTS